MTKLQHSFKHSGIMVLKVLQHTVHDLSPLWNWEVWYSLKNNVITWVQGVPSRHHKSALIPSNKMDKISASIH